MADPEPVPLQHPRTGVGCCVECLEWISRSELMDFSGSLVCARCKPYAVEKIRKNEMLGGIWRRGNQLVLRRWKRLPARCVKCNGPAQWERVQVKVRRDFAIELSLCAKHRKQWRDRILIGVAICAASLLFGVFVSLPIVLGFVQFPATLGIVFGVGALIGMNRGYVFHLVLKPGRITRDVGYFTGAGKEFLDQLPEWPEP